MRITNSKDVAGRAAATRPSVADGARRSRAGRRRLRKLATLGALTLGALGLSGPAALAARGPSGPADTGTLASIPWAAAAQRLGDLTIPAGVRASAASTSQGPQVGRVVSLNAGGLLSAEPGERLGYRWEIVTRPNGSSAPLQGALDAHPTLRPDRPGRYVLEVTTGRVAAGATGRESRRERSLCARGCSTRTIALTVAPAAGDLGTPVNTIWYGGAGWGVQIGDPSTPAGQFYAAPDPADALQLLVLNRGTLAMLQNASFANDAAGASALLADVAGLSSSDLVIITKPDPLLTNATDSTPAVTIDETLATIGAPAVPGAVATGDAPWSATGGCSAFSAIGVPGLPAGQGQVNPCVASITSTGTLGGDIQGYLRQDLTATHYTFVDDERVPFDTGDPSADPAVVTVGSDEPGSPVTEQTYTSAPLSGFSGFFVVVLNAGTLAPEAQQTFIDINTDNANGVEGLSDMVTMLATWDSDPNALVIVRSVGKVARVGGGPWGEVASELQTLGGSQYYFDALDGTGAGYAQVGPAGTAGYPSPWTQVATSQRSGSGRLTGLLARNNLAQFYPDESYPTDLQDPSRPLAGTLPGIVSLPTSPWPDRDTPGDQDVLDCLAAHVNPLGAMATPIESNYTDQSLVDDWAAWASKIAAPSYYQTLTSYTGCGALTQTDFDNVAAQLEKEWTAVPLVWSLIDSFKASLVDSQGNASQIGKIANDVEQDVNVSSQQASIDPLSLSSDALWVLSTIPGYSEFGDALNFLAGGLGVADDLNNQSDGTNEMQQQITTAAANLGAELETRYTTSIQGLGAVGDILVGDWTKLQDAAENAADTTNAAADWSWTSAQTAQATDGILLATRRQAYEALLPLAYNLYRLQPGDATPAATDAPAYTCTVAVENAFHSATYLDSWQPFASIPANYDGDVPVVNGAGAVEPWVYAGADSSFLTNANGTGQYPGQDLLNAIFATPPSDPIQSAPLFNPLQFAVEAYNNLTTHTTTVTHTTVKATGATSDTYCQATATNDSNGLQPGAASGH
ncbi:MAG: hypothetical protein ACLP50_31925 [Solirubrobacteraceae bacterium]